MAKSEGPSFTHQTLRVNTLAPSFPGLDAPVNEDEHTTFLLNLL